MNTYFVKSIAALNHHWRAWSEADNSAHKPRRVEWVSPTEFQATTSDGEEIRFTTERYEPFPGSTPDESEADDTFDECADLEDEI